MQTKIKLLILIAAFIGISNSAKAQYNVLHYFGDTIIDGQWPNGDLYLSGNYLYGMTSQGGANDLGIIFKIKPDGTGYLKLKDFGDTTDAAGGAGSLISDGTFLYGMTYQGGLYHKGTIFKIMPDGSSYTRLLDFGGSIGKTPDGSLFYDGTFLYGTTSAGGANNMGLVFKIKTDGTAYADLLDFAGTTNGRDPVASLFYDGTFLYGTTKFGGLNDHGTVFKIKPDGTAFANLHNFSGTPDGAEPHGSLISDGSFLYGMTYSGGTPGINQGTVFKIMPDGTGYQDLLDFNNANGQNPYGSLLYDGTFLYGTTAGGGTNDNGVIFKIKPDGTNYNDLFDFATTTGTTPEGSFIYDGNYLYGTAYAGGIGDSGVIFKYALSSTVGVGQMKINNEELEIYPNPTTGNFTIAQNNSTLTEIEIHNIVGELIYKTTSTNQQTKLDLTKQPKGIYFIRTTDNKRNITNRKIVIQ